jgi:hypothetical protein
LHQREKEEQGWVFKLKKVRFLRGCRKKCVGGVERKIMGKKMLRS